MKNTFKILAISLLGGFMSLFIYKTFFEKPEVRIIKEEGSPYIQLASRAAPGEADFVKAAESSLNTVVHVKTSATVRRGLNPFEELFFGRGMQAPPQIARGSGSGVIISNDGYIVTNNHVIANAEDIQVVLFDNRELSAKVIGTDPTTDIALLKIETDDLQSAIFANSDEIKVGEWVLAVGNPFNLTNTVTAGIVSAKGRSINILSSTDRTAIEAFIQTDAAVNPGNSGGALVNTRGELVGINTAISSRTGSFEGYSFAVPSNIVRKVVEDLMQFGTVQRAFIGVNITDLTPALVKELGIKLNAGVYVSELSEGGAAKEAGLEKGDVIVSVEGKKVNRSSELQEIIGRKRPGDKVSVTVVRNNKEKDYQMVLRNIEGNTDLVKAERNSVVILGANFNELSSEDKKKYGLTYGIIVTELGNGKLSKASVPKGFIITAANNRPIRTVKDLDNLVKELKTGEGLLIQGYRPDGRADYFGFGL